MTYQTNLPISDWLRARTLLDHIGHSVSFLYLVCRVSGHGIEEECQYRENAQAFVGHVIDKKDILEPLIGGAHHAARLLHMSTTDVNAYLVNAKYNTCVLRECSPLDLLHSSQRVSKEICDTFSLKL